MTASTSDVVAEHKLGATLNQRQLDALGRGGIAAIDLAKQWDGEFSFVLQRLVVFTGPDRFEFGSYVKHGEAVSAFTFVVENEFGEPADIAAWRPPMLALWLGRVAMLGEEQVLGPRLDEPLVVHHTVTSWFQAARRGVFIVDYTQAADVLRNESLVVETIEHARLLRKKLTIAAPPIKVAAGFHDIGAAA